MRVVCETCSKQFAIPDDKIPEGKEVSVPCPNCKGPIKLVAASPGDASASSPSQPPAPGQGGETLDKPFDYLATGVRTVLVCVDEKNALDKIRQNMGKNYHLTEAKNAVDALKKIRAHTYDLAIINERFEGAEPDDNPIVGYLERMTMEYRRATFVVLLTERFRTMDNLAAFKYSVNLLVNLKQVDIFVKILERALAEHEAFYRVFKEVQGRM